jgi:benzodiazapine receptor
MPPSTAAPERVPPSSPSLPPAARPPLRGTLAISAATAAVYLVSGAVTASSVGGWYQTLARPAFNPPDWVFAPVWAALYVAMAVAAILAWRGAGADGARRRAVGWTYGVQLALNGLWSVLFFGLQAPGAALAEGLVLLGAILWTMRVFAPADRRAAWLFAPYAAWVGFAMVLNGAIWLAN